MSNSTINTDDSSFKLFQTYVDRPKKFDLDPLLLAVSAKDLTDKNNGTHYGLYDDIRVFSNITAELQQRAEDIRQYYSKKLFWDSLNGKPLSPIRSRLSVLLEHRIMECSDNDIGLYWKLPYFYEEDCVYDEFKKTYNTERLSPLGNKVSNKFAKRLEYLKSTTGMQKNNKFKNFWFADDNDDLYAIQITLGNELLTLFESLLSKNNNHIFETYLKESRIDKLHFYKLYSFKFLKDHNA